ncbi:uncharacterized protein PFL1_00983 [Pseudozyma flocculosa PF-1]|uniref:Related to PDR16 - involved in lipid biosynthesis and multidrug resistance n=1 Tax=Pseudozyma flocculosa TaxID=84751 RepID=A0A5C3FAR1_9BASI|nr:uncharacterized protein PFL1_00983 [Pseudozyma flocculosa PF-1]EPQ31650.1 hypothetical protein PFL1_00983 [Pseudozyma flocculosa PF-1]SPO40765.1 related to PDR16 - involved in lipid biosynthesis and multidrug resistance [Pseudozyma flocculosa]
MSSTFDRLTKSSSRASRTSSNQSRPVSSFMSRASSYMTGNRRNQGASESQASTLDPNMGITATPQQSRGGLRPFQGVFPAPDASVKLSRPKELSEDQERKYQQMLEHFRSVEEYPVSLKDSSAGKKPLDDWERLRMLSRESMLRYLRATKWDVAAAKKRLTDTIVWRRDYGVDSLDPAQLEPEAETGKETILGYDKRARPLHYMHPSRNTTEETPRQMQFAVWMLEAAIDLMPPGVEQLALLINFGGKNRNPTSISNAKLMLYILQNHYVERLGIALCINVPWLFKAFWNAIYPFIDPVTKSKCKFDEAIKEEVPASQLAADFGGEVDFQYDHAKYWPDLVGLVQQRREEQLKRFREDCNGEIGASEWVIRGGDEQDPRSALKKDSAYAESPELTAAAIAAQTAAASAPAAVAAAAAGAAVPEADVGPASPSTPTPKPEKQVTYQSGSRVDSDTDSLLDRFVTSQEELPEDPLAKEAGEQLSQTNSDSENTTVVNDAGDAPPRASADSRRHDASEAQPRSSSDSRKHHFGSLFHRNSKKEGKHHHQRGASTAGSGNKEHDKSLFSAVVGNLHSAVHRNSSDEHHKRGHASEADADKPALRHADSRNVVHAV